MKSPVIIPCFFVFSLWQTILSEACAATGIRRSSVPGTGGPPQLFPLRQPPCKNCMPRAGTPGAPPFSAQKTACPPRRKGGGTGVLPQTEDSARTKIQAKATSPSFWPCCRRCGTRSAEALRSCSSTSCFHRNGFIFRHCRHEQGQELFHSGYLLFITDTSILFMHSRPVCFTHRNMPKTRSRWAAPHR